MLTLSTFLTLALAADAERTLAIEVGKTLPVFKQVEVFRSGAKSKKPLSVITSGTSALLSDAGPFDVIATPKSGLPLLVAKNLLIPAGATHIVKLEEILGVVQVFGDKFPRAEAVVLTTRADPGPGEKGHTPVQKVSDYRVDMVVPAGTYAVWVVPANGARAQKIDDDVKVLAGRTVRVE